ncbi:hypothetical protein [Thermovibrio sp.]
MLLSEFLFNLLSLNSSWKVIFNEDSNSVVIYVDKGKIVRVELNGEVLSEKEVEAFLREKFTKEEEIEDVELLPFDRDIEFNLSLDQGNLFSLISQDSEGKEEFKEEKEEEKGLLGSIKELLKEYFPESAFSLFEYEESPLFKELSSCSHSIFNFKNYSVLLIKGLPVAIFVVSDEVPTLELYEREIVSKLVSLTSQN